MVNIITTVTALIGCLLGIYNFLENMVVKIKNQRTNIEFNSRGGVINYRIIDAKKNFETDYDAAEVEETIFRFTIKNNSSHPVFFYRCGVVNYKRNMLFGGMKESDSVSTYIEKNNFYKFDGGKEMPIICPFKIDAYDVCAILYKSNVKHGYYQSKDYQQILLRNEKERKTSYDKIYFSYVIDNMCYEKEVYADVTYYKM